MNTKIVLSCVLAQATLASATSLFRGGRNNMVENAVKSPRRQRKAKSEKFKLFQEPVYDGIMKDLLIYDNVTACLDDCHIPSCEDSCLCSDDCVTGASGFNDTVACFEECESICVGECIADTGSFLDAAVDRDLWCTEIECKTRIIEEDIADDDDGDDDDGDDDDGDDDDGDDDDGDDDDGDDDDGDDDDGDDDDGDDDDDSTPAPSPSPTAAPVTESPTITAPPVTESPTITAPPVTESPTTAAPVTEMPTTAAPVTEMPTTAAPVTDMPTTAAPVTEMPTTAAPVTEMPTTDAPTGWATVDDVVEDDAMSMR